MVGLDIVSSSMFSFLKNRLIGVVLVVWSASLLHSRADILVWDANNATAGAQDGSGTWTVGLPNWFNQTGGLNNQSWIDGSDAIFGSGTGTAGTVTLGGSITIANLTFNTTGSGSYTIGGSNVLTLSNSLLTTNVSATISAIIGGTTNWTKAGAGQLTLSGASTNTNSGKATVSGGRLELAKTGGANALSGDLLIDGGVVTFLTTTTNQIDSTSAVTMNQSTSAFNGTGPNAGIATVTQTLASLTINGGTFNSGSGSNWNIGSVTFSGASNALFVGNSASVQTFGSLSLTGMNGISSSSATTNGFTIFGNGGPVRTSLTIGSGGLFLDGSKIYLGSGSSGSQLVLNGNVSTGGTSVSTIERVSGGVVEPFVSLSGVAGTVSRTFDIAGNGANLNILATINNGAATSASLVKTGEGTLTLGGIESNTYTGETIVNGGTLALSKSAGIIAVAGDLRINTGGTLTFSQTGQTAATTNIIVDGGTISGLTRDQTFARYTQLSGGLTASGNSGDITIGTMTLSGGNQVVINSGNAVNAADWNINTLVMTGADILVGGNSGVGSPVTNVVIGSGGLTISGRTITVNHGSSGAVLTLNGDVTGTGSSNILAASSGGVTPYLEIGGATRTFTINNGTTQVGLGIRGVGGSLMKKGAGRLYLFGANTYSGTTTVREGELSVNGAAGTLSATTALVVSGGGSLVDGSLTAANNNGVSNRINTAATLTLGDSNGGGSFSLLTPASGFSHMQTLESLTISGGSNTVSSIAGAGAVTTLTFGGANPYSHTAGIVNFLQNPASGGSILFTNAPSGAGNVSGGILVGATLNGTDLITAQSGVLTAFTGWIPTGTATWTNGGNMDVTGSNPVAFSSTAINALRFNTLGAYTMLLSGVHTIDSGMLLVTSAVGANRSTISGGELQGAVSDGLRIAQNNTSEALAISSVIRDNTTASDLWKTGAGTVLLSGTNTYSGLTGLSAGILAAGNDAAFGTSTVDLAGGTLQAVGGTRTLGNDFFLSQSSTVSGDESIVVNGSFVNRGSLSGVTNNLLSGKALTLGGGVFLSNDDTTQGRELQFFGTGDTVIDGVIANNAFGNSVAAGISFNGGGRLILNGINTYSGRTLVAGGGYLGISADRNLGAVPLPSTVDSILLAASGRILTTTTFALDANRSIGIGNSTGGSATGRMEVGTNATLTVSGTIADRTVNVDGTATPVNVGSLQKLGLGTLALGGENTYSGSTSVSSGILLITSNNALGSTSGGTSVSSSAVLLLGDGVTVTGESLSLSGAGTTGPGAPTLNRGALQVTENATAEWAGNVTMAGNQARIGVQEGGILRVSGTISDGGNNYDVRFSGELSGTGGLYLSGSGNSWGGQTEVVRGTVFLGAHDVLPTTTVLDIHFTSSNNDEYAAVDLNGFNQTVGSLRNEGNSGTKAELRNTSGTLSTLTVNETGTITYNGTISGNLALVKGGAGTLTLAIENTFTGGALVSAGTLALGHVNSLKNSTLDTGTTGSQQVTFTAAGTNTYLLGGLKGSDNVALGANSIQVGANDENTSFQGVLSGTGGLIKEGSGTLTLAGDNLYTGPTAVNEGRLTINGNQTLSTGAITVASGATLGGTGTMGGDTSIAGFLDGGAAPATVGTLTFAGATTDLTLQSGSTWLVDVVQGAIDNSDTVNVGGALSIDANAMLSVAFAGTFTPHSVYTIANYGSLSGTFNGLAEGAFVDAGMKYFINYGGGTNGSITLTAVPEPGTLGFLGLAVGGFFLRRHRKKKGARA